jgi:hypothetical protein
MRQTAPQRCPAAVGCHVRAQLLELRASANCAPVSGLSAGVAARRQHELGAEHLRREADRPGVLGAMATLAANTPSAMRQFTVAASAVDQLSPIAESPKLMTHGNPGLLGAADTSLDTHCAPRILRAVAMTHRLFSRMAVWRHVFSRVVHAVVLTGRVMFVICERPTHSAPCRAKVVVIRVLRRCAAVGKTESSGNERDVLPPISQANASE